MGGSTATKPGSAKGGGEDVACSWEKVAVEQSVGQQGKESAELHLKERKSIQA